jgi:hypothetical protein
MIEEGWLLFVIWLSLLGLSLNVRDDLFKVVAGFVGVLLSILFMQDSNSMVQYAGLGILMLNLFVIVKGLLSS